MDPDLAPAVARLGGYEYVGYGYLGETTPTLREAIDGAISWGVQRILFIPSLTTCNNGRFQSLLEEEVAYQRKAHTDLDFIIVPSGIDVERHAAFLVYHLQAQGERGEPSSTIPLNMLPTHAHGTVQRLNGGHEFVSRLSVLGFIPGASVEVVQNFGVGPLIVTVRDARIALGREEARKVRVTMTDKGATAHRAHRGRRRSRRGRFE